MSHPFKVGDRIRCIQAVDHLRPGDEATVAFVDNASVPSNIGCLYIIKVAEPRYPCGRSARRYISFFTHAHREVTDFED